jgi:hypothetical protein
LQRGRQYRQILTKTKEKAWSIYAAEDVPAGAFVCEYMGEVVRVSLFLSTTTAQVLTEDEAHAVGGNRDRYQFRLSHPVPEVRKWLVLRVFLNVLGISTL